MLPSNDPLLVRYREQILKLQREQFDPKTLPTWPEILAWWTSRYGSTMTKAQILKHSPEMENPIIFRRIAEPRAQSVETETYVMYRVKQEGPYSG
jgi:hypothetical protein